ncbi:MAG: class I SAM-dependent methyltransferase [Acidobacteria bacterium]|nr:class I SAM-dependent methyltransferase [Acidobacteriota bacterium]
MNRRHGHNVGQNGGAWPDSQARSYDEWYETALGRLCLRLESRAIFALAGIKPGEAAIDLGCGTGVFSLEAARRGARTVGVDSSAAMLAIAGSKAEHSDLPVSFLRADAESLPFPSESLDLVLAVTALCLAGKPAAVLQEAFRVLKPGGRLVIGELNRRSYWAWLRQLKGRFSESVYRHARFLTFAELDTLLFRVDSSQGKKIRSSFFRH